MEQGAYRRCYEYLVRLQILDEIESLAKTESSEEVLKSLFAQWKTRTEFSQSSLCNLEPVLRTRRALLELIIQQHSKKHSNHVVFLKNELGECWLSSAKAARKAGQLNKAYNLLLEAEKFQHKEVFIERAKLCWQREFKTEAISVLQKGIVEHYPELKSGIDRKNPVDKIEPSDLHICGKAKLLLARYVDEAANFGHEIVTMNYSEAKSVNSRSEEAYVYNARYLEKSIGKIYKDSK